MDTPESDPEQGQTPSSNEPSSDAEKQEKPPEVQIPPLDAENPSEQFPCPFDDDNEYEIVEPTENEDSDDGFADIPPGPTEEVSFEPPRPRRFRKRHERLQKPRIAEEPVRRRKAPVLAIIIIAAALVLLVLAIILFARSGK